MEMQQTQSIRLSYMPAVRSEFVKNFDSGNPDTITLYRPYAALPLATLEKQLQHPDPMETIGAGLELGERYYFGIGVQQDDLKAFGHFVKAAELGAQDAAYMVAECYRVGRGVKQDFEQYFVWLKAAVDGGSWMAMFNLAAAYREGKKPYGGFGVVIDHEQSLYWTERAELAIRAYWDFYTQAGFVDFEETLKRLLQAYAQATHLLSAHHADGIGTVRNLDRALFWLERGKRFAAQATGELRQPVFDDAIAKLKERIVRDQIRKSK